ncbi:hypothetical protein C0995_014914, partial [Termitomyces sp. Mi166
MQATLASKVPMAVAGPSHPTSKPVVLVPAGASKSLAKVPLTLSTALITSVAKSTVLVVVLGTSSVLTTVKPVAKVMMPETSIPFMV